MSTLAIRPDEPPNERHRDTVPDLDPSGGGRRPAMSPRDRSPASSRGSQDDSSSTLSDRGRARRRSAGSERSDQPEEAEETADLPQASGASGSLSWRSRRFQTFVLTLLLLCRQAWRIPLLPRHLTRSPGPPPPARLSPRLLLPCAPIASTTSFRPRLQIVPPRLACAASLVSLPIPATSAPSRPPSLPRTFPPTIDQPTVCVDNLPSLRRVAARGRAR